MQSLLPDPQPSRGRYAKGVVVSRLNTIRSFLAAGWDAYRAARQGEAGLSRRQQERLRDLVAYARAHSAYFADLYRDVPEVVTDVAQLPVVTKAEMMHHFDQWVTDPSVNREQIEAFLADPTLIGHDYLNRYVVLAPHSVSVADSKSSAPAVGTRVRAFRIAVPALPKVPTTRSLTRGPDAT